MSIHSAANDDQFEKDKNEKISILRYVHRRFHESESLTEIADMILGELLKTLEEPMVAYRP